MGSVLEVQRRSTRGSGCEAQAGGLAATGSLVSQARSRSRRASALVLLAALLAPAGTAQAKGGPSLTDAPTAVGTAAAGKQLTALSGNWAGSQPLTYRYQWYRCNAAGASCATISGAHSQTYALGPKDVGKTVGLTVWATDAAGTSYAYASLVGPIAPTRPLLETTAQPVVTGSPDRSARRSR